MKICDFCWQQKQKTEILLTLLWFVTFFMEGNTTFQLEVNKNEDVFFFPIQVHRLHVVSIDPG